MDRRACGKPPEFLDRHRDMETRVLLLVVRTDMVGKRPHVVRSTHGRPGELSTGTDKSPVLQHGWASPGREPELSV